MQKAEQDRQKRIRMQKKRRDWGTKKIIKRKGLPPKSRDIVKTMEIKRAYAQKNNTRLPNKQNKHRHKNKNGTRKTTGKYQHMHETTKENQQIIKRKPENPTNNKPHCETNCKATRSSRPLRRSVVPWNEGSNALIPWDARGRRKPLNTSEYCSKVPSERFSKFHFESQNLTRFGTRCSKSTAICRL